MGWVTDIVELLELNSFESYSLIIMDCGVCDWDY